RKTVYQFSEPLVALRLEISKAVSPVEGACCGKVKVYSQQVAAAARSTFVGTNGGYEQKTFAKQ
ncbi:Hypothetical predicted protein, partial [Marmota monax]